MYALMKTQGVTAQPWTSHLRYGAVEHDGAVHISLYVGGDQPWSGRLVVDAPRHNSAMRLPLDWPRINQFPEWFTAKPDKTYEFQSITDGTVTHYTGKALQASIPVSLQPNAETRITVRME